MSGADFVTQLFLVQNQHQVHSILRISSPYRERQCFAQKNREFVIHFGYFFLSFLRFIEIWRIIETQLICLFPYYDEAEFINTSSLIRFLCNLNFSFKHSVNHAKLFQNFTKQLTLEISKILFCWIRRKLLVERKQNMVMEKANFWKRRNKKILRPQLVDIKVATCDDFSHFSNVAVVDVCGVLCRFSFFWLKQMLINQICIFFGNSEAFSSKLKRDYDFSGTFETFVKLSIVPLVFFTVLSSYQNFCLSNTRQLEV